MIKGSRTIGAGLFFVYFCFRALCQGVAIVQHLLKDDNIFIIFENLVDIPFGKWYNKLVIEWLFTTAG